VPADRDTALRQAAIKLESRFLSEMLKASGLDGNQTGFSGGVGEEQFRSFLRDAQADAMARTGGVGLAESLFQALKARDHG
jgi:Rod binding domain-containing protein